MFQNVIIPDAPIDSMHGLMRLLALVGTPAAEESAAFLLKLSAEKDAAAGHLTAANEKLVRAAKIEQDAANVAEETRKRGVALDMDAARLKREWVDLRSDLTALKQDQEEHLEAVKAHAEMVKEHCERVAAADRREFELDAREERLKAAAEALAAKQREFDERMKPILAAAGLAKTGGQS